MLVGVSVIPYIMIKIIRVGKKQITLCKNKRTTHIYFRQLYGSGLLAANTSLL